MDRGVFFRTKRKTFILELGNCGPSAIVCLHLPLMPTRIVVLKKDISYRVLIVYQTEADRIRVQRLQ